MKLFCTQWRLVILVPLIAASTSFGDIGSVSIDGTVQAKEEGGNPGPVPLTGLPTDLLASVSESAQGSTPAIPSQRWNSSELVTSSASLAVFSNGFKFNSSSTSSLTATTSVDAVPNPVTVPVFVFCETISLVNLNFTNSTPMRLNLSITGGDTGDVSSIYRQAYIYGSEQSDDLTSYGQNSIWQPGSYRVVCSTYPQIAHEDDISLPSGTSKSFAGGATFNVSIQATQVSTMKVFAAGVNWTATQLPDGGSTVQGNAGASLFQKTLAKLPNFVPTGNPITLNAADPGNGNLLKLESTFAGWSANLKSGDTAVIYLASHGGLSNGKPVVDLTNDPNGQDLTADELDAMLLTYVATKPDIRTILVMDSCHSGGFASDLSNVPNLYITTSTKDGQSLSTSDPDSGIGDFTTALSSLIAANAHNGNFDISMWPAQINAYVPGGFFGTERPLDDSGSEVFAGLDSGFVASQDFSGDLISPALSVPEPSSVLYLVIATSLLFLRQPSSRSPLAQ